MPQQGMMPPEGIPQQGMMPPEMGMPPQEGMQAPIGMADGGIVYLAEGGLPPRPGGPTTIDERLFRQATQPQQGVLSRLGSRFASNVGSIDDAVRGFMGRAVQTNPPMTASGRPIPFVDSQGRFYQPAGGTDPRMASRGMQMPSRFNLGRFATRFGGPAALNGG
jgi:hypothetical protein